MRRYVVVTKTEIIEKKFNVQAEFDQFTPNYNVSAGNLAPVITSEKPDRLQLYCFGYSPSWGKRMYVLNARAEGDRNQENDPKYSGSKDIITKPMWKQAIRNRRCLVIADAFIEGPEKEKLKKHFLVYLREVRAFAFASLYNELVNTESGEITGTFSIITTTANKLLQKIGHHRSPVILRDGEDKQWLKGIDLGSILPLLKPYESAEMNAYPISPEISKASNKSKEFIRPTGDRLFKEYEVVRKSHLEMYGMGELPSKKKVMDAKDQDMKEKQLNEKKRMDDIEDDISGQTDGEFQ